MTLTRVKSPIVLVCLVLLMNAFASIRGTDGDSFGTLLVADSILRYGTVSLDHYSHEILEIYGTRIRLSNGLPFYYFPLGTALISVPFVAIAECLGFDPILHDAIIQRLIASLSSVLTLFLMIRIAKQLRNDESVWIVPTLFWFGSALTSTTGLALESHNFAIVFALIAIHDVIRVRDNSTSYIWWRIGIAIFFAYLIRPTFSVFGFYLLFWLFLKARFAALKAGLLVLSLAAVFILFSLHTYGQILPDYYLPKRLEGGDFFKAFIGNLISPARGLFVFSSFIAVVWLFPRHQGVKWGRGCFFISVLWPLTHLVIISRFPHWWGGHSYGPRLMIDCLPGLLLLTLAFWPSVSVLKANQLRATALIISVIFSLVVNTGQGMFNPWTAHWSNAPDIDDYPEYLFDWRYPQFLANERGHQRRAAEFKTKYQRDAWPRARATPKLP